MLEGEANGELANAEQQENDNNVEVMSDENKKILNKRLVTMLGDELDKFVKELDAVSPVEREKALATLQAVANEFFVAGGEASVAAALVRSTFLTTATSRQARAKAINERLWTGMVNDTTFIAGLRQALDWAPLTIENITEMTPLEKNRSILPRWQVISELLKASASASSLTEAQRELFVAARVHKLLMTQLVWATRLPQLKAVWSGGEEEKFIATMRRISETHDRVLKQSESEELTMPPATVAFVSAPERCYTCGRVGHMAFQCSQTQQLCYSCRQPGHIAKSCPMAGSASAAFARGGGRGGGRGGRGGYGGGSRGNVVATTVASEKPVVKKSMFDYPYSYSQTSFVVLTIDEKIRAVWESAPLLVRVLAQGGPQLPAVECEMLVDTGAIPSVVSSRFVASIGAATRPSRTRCIRGVGDTSTLIAGETTIGVTMGGRSFAVTALVAETALFDFLLGTRGMRAQGVEPVKIEIDESGGRVCVAGSAWVPAIGWTPSHVAVETVHVLRDESAAWRSTPSSVFLPVAGVGVLHAQLELGNDEGLSVADVLEVMGYATELPVAMTTGQEAHVAEALRAIAAADRDGREGAAWTLPNLEPSEPLVAAGPELQGPDREAYKSVAIGPGNKQKLN